MTDETTAPTYENPLDNPYVQRWLADLESGRYQQGAPGYLKQINTGTGEVGYCCLGVACEALKDELGLTYTLSSRYGSGGYVADYGDCAVSSLPEPVRNALGLSHSLGKYEGGALFSDNDGDPVVGEQHRRKSFKEIADIIRSRPRGLFLVDTYENPALERNQNESGAP